MCESYPKKLIIIGNGFDLWLSLPTKYENYKEYLSKEYISNNEQYKNCYKLFKLVEQIFEKNKWTVNLWSNLEQNLFNLLNNKKNIIDDLVNEINNENIDLIEAIIEKNISIKNWICQIRSKHEEKLNKLNEWYKKIIQQNYSFVWNFNYVQNWRGMEFYLPYDRQILCVAEAHGHYATYQNLEWGSELGFQLGASWQQIINENDNNKYNDYLIESRNSLIKELKEAVKNDLEIKDEIKKWVKSHPLFFLLLFCCKHKDIVEQLQNTFKTSVDKNCIHKDFIRYLDSIGLDNIKNALYLNSDTQKRPSENFNIINHACLPIKFWKQNNTFPDIYILGLNIDGQDKLYFVNDETSPLKLSIKNGKECYLSYYGDNDKKVKKEQYKKVLQIKDDNIINDHVLEFKDLTKKAFGLDLFNELMVIKKIS